MGRAVRNFVRAVFGVGSPWALATAWVLWSHALALMYIVLALGCRYGIAEQRFAGVNALTGLLAAVWLGHVLLLAGLTWYAWRAAPAARTGAADTTGFITFGVKTSYAAAWFATAWLGYPVLMLHPCS
jgi:hypothetical protein